MEMYAFLFTYTVQYIALILFWQIMGISGWFFQ